MLRYPALFYICIHTDMYIYISMQMYSYQISPKGTRGIFWGAVLLVVIMTPDSALGIQQSLCCCGLSFPCRKYFLPPWQKGRMAIELGCLPPPTLCLTGLLSMDALPIGCR